jgi:hypothetical protein
MSTAAVLDVPVSLTLRPYQRDALTAIAAAWQVARALPSPPPCGHCQGTVFWTNAGGQPVCPRCHPQPQGA